MIVRIQYLVFRIVLNILTQSIYKLETNCNKISSLPLLLEGCENDDLYMNGYFNYNICINFETLQFV